MRRVVLTLSLVLAGVGPATAGRLPNDPPLVLDIHEGSFRLCMGWKTPTLITEAGTLKPLLWPNWRYCMAVAGLGSRGVAWGRGRGLV